MTIGNCDLAENSNRRGGALEQEVETLRFQISALRSSLESLARLVDELQKRNDAASRHLQEDLTWHEREIGAHLEE